MTPIEDRLREAFDTSAGQVRPHPHARSENLRRLGRADSRARRSISVISAAAVGTAATTMVTFALVGRSPSVDPTVPRPSVSGSSTSPAPLSMHLRDILRQVPPTTAVIRLDPPRGLGDPSFHWFGRTRRQGLMSCNVIVRGESVSGGCAKYQPLRRGQVVSSVQSGDIYVIERPKNMKPALVSNSGWVQNRATAVTAVLPDGTRIPGVIGGGRGFPAKAWRVAVPGRPRHVTFVFTDAAGRVVTSFLMPVTVVSQTGRRG